MTIIRAEIATKSHQHREGLMGRKHLPKDSGMLFDFGDEQPLSFWMANTYIPLQVAFITSSGKIGQIESMVPLSTRAVRSRGEYRYALEANDGWFDSNKIFVGAQVVFPFGTQKDLPAGANSQQELLDTALPEVTVKQSFKDILKALDDYGVKLVVEYQTKKGIVLPPKAIEPPIEFGTTAEGDVDGLATAWDSQKADYISLIVENIISIKDQNGNPVETVEQVQALSSQKPLTMEEEFGAKGKLAPK